MLEICQVRERRDIGNLVPVEVKLYKGCQMSEGCNIADPFPVLGVTSSSGGVTPRGFEFECGEVCQVRER